MEPVEGFELLALHSNNCIDSSRKNIQSALWADN
jgi:hypothetical protein